MKKRNLYVHGLWLIDGIYAQGADEETMTYMKDKRKRDGVEICSESIPLEEFERMIQACVDCSYEIEVLSDILCARKPVKDRAEDVERHYDIKP